MCGIVCMCNWNHDISDKENELNEMIDFCFVIDMHL